MEERSRKILEEQVKRSLQLEEVHHLVGGALVQLDLHVSELSLQDLFAVTRDEFPFTF